MSTFILKSIPIALNPESINNAIKIIKDLEEKLKPATEKLVEHFAKEGVTIVRGELLLVNPPAYYTGALADSATYHIDKKSGSATVTAGEGCLANYDGIAISYAIMVEYGTGIYSEKDHIGHSWGKYGWMYFNPRDNMWHHTVGMPARRFMHNSLDALEEKAFIDGGRVIAEYLGE